eukprot:7183847-Pyramimonas_sp.AAC.1
MFRFNVESKWYNTTFNPHSPWAQQLPDTCGRNLFILAMMRNMDWKDDVSFVLPHWTPHLFAILEDDATQRLVGTSPYDAITHDPALGPLLNS